MSKINRQIINPLFIIGCFSILILFSGCSKDNILNENQFVKVYADIIITQDTTSLKNASIDSVKEIIFKKHNITAQEYNATINYYNQSPEKWGEFFKKAVAYVEELKKQVHQN